MMSMRSRMISRLSGFPKSSPSLYRKSTLIKTIQVWVDRNNASVRNEHTKCHRTCRCHLKPYIFRQNIIFCHILARNYFCHFFGCSWFSSGITLAEIISRHILANSLFGVADKYLQELIFFTEWHHVSHPSAQQGSVPEPNSFFVNKYLRLFFHSFCLG